MKVATWNINSIKSRLEHVVRWCESARPDVVCLQETKTVDKDFPFARFASAGYEYVAAQGERSYNGVAILSRSPLEDIENALPGKNDDDQKRFLTATVDGLRIVNVYIPHGTKFGSEKFEYKLDWIKRLREYFDERFTANDLVLLCGDLNVAPHELDVWNPNRWKEKLHFTKPERDAIQDLKRWGFVDLFRQINDDEREYSWWDHMEWSFRKDQGLRIDHLWASQALAGLCSDCWIDKEPRGWELPSDHAPVVAELLLKHSI